jgi:tRNA threonylcarbamoyladenosine modification (KEOPS) complex Cgi121 subunit
MAALQGSHCARSCVQRALDRAHEIDDAAAVIVRKFHGRILLESAAAGALKKFSAGRRIHNSFLLDKISYFS